MRSGLCGDAGLNGVAYAVCGLARIAYTYISIDKIPDAPRLIYGIPARPIAQSFATQKFVQAFEASLLRMKIAGYQMSHDSGP